jgi:hypothetical protein
MKIHFRCPRCTREYQVDRQFAGRTTHCRYCRAPFIVPLLGSPQPDQPALAQLIIPYARVSESSTDARQSTTRARPARQAVKTSDFDPTPFLVLTSVLLGCCVSVPLSYFFQSNLLRTFLSFSDYVRILPRVIIDSNAGTFGGSASDAIANTFILTTFFVMALFISVGFGIGILLKHSKKPTKST